MIILCTSDSPSGYLDDIAKDLNTECPGVILIDEFLHAGNTDKRFLAYVFDGTKLSGDKFVKIKKVSPMRKLTCDFLKEENLLVGTIITSIQRRMIEKGIVVKTTGLAGGLDSLTHIFGSYLPCSLLRPMSAQLIPFFAVAFILLFVNIKRCFASDASR